MRKQTMKNLKQRIISRCLFYFKNWRIKLYLVSSLFLLSTYTYADNVNKTIPQSSGYESTLTDLENELTKAEKKHGKHAEELLPILKRLVITTQNKNPKLSKAYNIRRTRIHLRHNSAEFVANFVDFDLPITKHSKKMLSKMNKHFDRDFKIYNNKYWSVIYHESQEAQLAKKVIPLLEHSYDSALSFLISFGYRNKPLTKKMTAIYFQSKDDYKSFISKQTKQKVNDKSRAHYFRKIDALGFYDVKKTEAIQTVPRWVLLNSSSFQVMVNAGLFNFHNQPKWLTRGISTSFELMDKKRESGPHTNNYSPKRMNWITELQNQEALPSIDELVSASFKTENNPKNITRAYAMGSMLVRYLYKYHPEEFRSYLTILAKSDRSRASSDRKRMFSKAFGAPESLQANFETFTNETLAEFNALKTEKELKETVSSL